MTVADDVMWAIIAVIFLYFCWRMLSETKRASRHAKHAEENTRALIKILTTLVDLDDSDPSQNKNSADKHLGYRPGRSGNPENIEIVSKGYGEPRRDASGFFDREFNLKSLLYLAGGVMGLWLLFSLVASMTNQF